MTKIPTMFVRDEAVKGHPVMNRIKPECQWVLDGEGVATLKLDGTNAKVEGGQLFKRQKPKDRDYDEASYVACDRNNPADRWHFEAFDLCDGEIWPDGIYELVGPKIQNNPHRYPAHELVRVVPANDALVIDYVPRTFDGLKKYLADIPVEGVVFHHQDGRFAKIKRRDFGIHWP